MKYATAKVGLKTAQWLVSYYTQAARTAKRPTAYNAKREADVLHECVELLRELRFTQSADLAERRWLTS